MYAQRSPEKRENLIKGHLEKILVTNFDFQSQVRSKIAENLLIEKSLIESSLKWALTIHRTVADYSGFKIKTVQKWTFLKLVQ